MKYLKENFFCTLLEFILFIIQLRLNKEVIGQVHVGWIYWYGKMLKCFILLSILFLFRMNRLLQGRETCFKKLMRTSKTVIGTSKTGMTNSLKNKDINNI